MVIKSMSQKMTFWYFGVVMISATQAGIFDDIAGIAEELA